MLASTCWFCIFYQNQSYYIGDDGRFMPVLLSCGDRHTISCREPHELPVEIHIHLTAKNVAHMPPCAPVGFDKPLRELNQADASVPMFRRFVSCLRQRNLLREQPKVYTSLIHLTLPL